MEVPCFSNFFSMRGLVGLMDLPCWSKECTTCTPQSTITVATHSIHYQCVWSFILSFVEALAPYCLQLVSMGRTWPDNGGNVTEPSSTTNMQHENNDQADAALCITGALQEECDQTSHAPWFLRRTETDDNLSSSNGPPPSSGFHVFSLGPAAPSPSKRRHVEKRKYSHSIWLTHAGAL